MVLNAFLLSFDGYWAYTGFKGKSLHAIVLVIILVIKQTGLPLRVRPIFYITRMITDWIGLHSVLLPSLIVDTVAAPALSIVGQHSWSFCSFLK